MQIAEAFLIQKEGVEQCRIDGAAAATADDEGGSKSLKGADHLQDHVKEDQRSNQWSGDMKKRPDLTSAIGGCGIVVFHRNLFEASEKDDHRRTKLPDGLDNQCIQGEPGSGEPAPKARDTKNAEHLIYYPISSEELNPEDGDGYTAR